MKRVTGIGGIFFKTPNPDQTKEWYAKHLGIPVDSYGTSFEWRQSDEPGKKGFTAWSPMNESTEYFQPSESQFMINYRVEDLEKLVETLKVEGVTIVDQIETFEYGKFVHILDLDGNKLELWEPNDEFYDKMIEVRTK